MDEVVIIYVEEDKDLAKLCNDTLVGNDVSVWLPSVDQSPEKVTKAVIHCQCLIVVVSSNSLKCGRIKDLLSLAYITNCFIFPVASASVDEFLQYMDGGLKLLLLPVNWYVIQDKKSKCLKDLVSSVQENSVQVTTRNVIGEDDDLESTFYIGARRGTMQNVDIFPEESQEADFWKRHFEDETKVSWESFRNAFLKDYIRKIERLFAENDSRVHFVTLIQRDVFELADPVLYENYIEFLGGEEETSKPHAFFNLLKLYAVGSFAVREVFNMDSTVRYIAVENLGQYKSKGVVSALVDLLKDTDANMRAIAAVSLGRTGVKNKDIVSRLLSLVKDQDRLVRESACLSLGRLHATEAVDVLLNVWRNDAISVVREAAQVALQLLGGDKAEQAMAVLNILSSELQALKDMPPAETTKM